MNTKFLQRISKRKLYIWIAVIVLVALLLIISTRFGRSIEIQRDIAPSTVLLSKFDASDLCDNHTTRPIAVMLSSDPVARSLSGISSADIVFEMPITQGGVTRMMAVFRCEHPNDIGSIRSARLDFIPLVQGLDAIYSHWGGEAESLKQLNQGVTDNINGLIYDGTVYYRKNGIHTPHDGFTSFRRLQDKAQALGYDVVDDIQHYLFTDGDSKGEIAPLDIYQGDYQVKWIYDPATNLYERYRANLRERDAIDNAKTFVSNVVIMNTTWSPISVDYIHVATIGSGKATIYKDGQEIVGVWEKKSARSPLVFYDETEEEVVFTRGKIWINIVTK